MKTKSMQQEMYSHELREAADLFFEGSALRVSKRLLQTLVLAGRPGEEAHTGQLPLFFLRLRHLLERLPVLLRSGVRPGQVSGRFNKAFMDGYPGVLPPAAQSAPGSWLRSFLTSRRVRQLHRGLSAGMSAQAGTVRPASGFKVYRQFEQLLEACWLICHPYKPYASRESCVRLFQSTSPLALTPNEQSKPVAVITAFFSGWTILSAQRVLKQWFKAALAPGFCADERLASELLFFSNELTRVFEAGYLAFHEEGKNFVSESDARLITAFLDGEAPEEAVCMIRFNDLNSQERRKLRSLLSLTRIRQLRAGMNHWLQAAFSRSTSIIELDEVYMYPQFEAIEAILFGLYRLVTRGQGCETVKA
ncbi:hypothetical protein C7T94_16930 [Pedobacter yulinensis]|uniref:Uncharacterized protein n=1 Tax=Pedobacter yulinensis TaxID=2126353 RepID=A0A2T3HHG8_9SPHI|nr:hypothetical protein [Pedobacter yulinensis]PST81884.1 hypothetical protein C7T94_16930 [Pedobacter yulinensis]